MMDEFRRFFMRGLAALTPTLLTIALLMWAYRFVDNNIGQPITRLVVKLYAWGGPPHEWLGIDAEAALELGDPIDEWDEETGLRLTAQSKAIGSAGITSPDPRVKAAAEKAEREALWDLAVRKWPIFNIVGFVIGILLIYFVGHFLASFVGRKTWPMLEAMILRIPLIKTIYLNIKQVTDLLIADKALEFAGVVAIQYPRKGVWSIGLVTGPPMAPIRDRDKRELLTVFVPSSPTPFTGYTVTVSREEVMELPLSIDEALRYTVSGGVLRPGETSGVVESGDTRGLAKQQRSAD